MPVMAVNAVYRYISYCNLGAQIGENVWYLECVATTGASVTEGKFLLDLDAAMSSFYVTLLANTAIYYGSQLQKVFPLPINIAVQTNVNLAVGTGGAIALPTQTSGFIRKKTSLAGRHGRGRAYIPFPSAAHNIDPGMPSGAYTTLLSAFAAFLGSQFVSGALPDSANAEFVLTTPKNLAFTTPISGTVAVAEWATQKRRGSFGRVNALPF